MADEWDENSVEETLQSSFASRIEWRGLSLFLPLRGGSRWHTLDRHQLREMLQSTGDPLALSEQDEKLLVRTDALAVAKEKETVETSCIAMMVRENIRAENVQRAARRRDLFRLVLETAVRLGDAPVLRWVDGPPKESLALIVGRRIDERARKEAERNHVLVDLVHLDHDQDLPPLLRTILRARLLLAYADSGPEAARRLEGRIEGALQEIREICRDERFVLNCVPHMAFEEYPAAVVEAAAEAERTGVRMAPGDVPELCPWSAGEVLDCRERVPRSELESRRGPMREQGLSWLELGGKDDALWRFAW
ncbi:hypothetical protein [Verrucomicrobium sp. 3C]|uniref:hypothetical protein n=1 Tax=Verrucomicrobium sp. 3C TaxID=1134055 RepID=UPI00037BC5DF|nr:hypothetical protein [Verrucomicrobium sp. 3C]